MTASAPGPKPFIYGFQYYRAPTPDAQYWAEDLRRMANSGFNAVKFWAQWRWAHRGVGKFYFDDLDRLMDLAGQNGLAVTINLITDVGPAWMFEQYPDCRQVLNNGRVVEPMTIGCRQIGGYPGPCYNHPEARRIREEFVLATAARYGNHQAMGMWDVWNEPEQNAVYRTPDLETLACYCPHCREAFQRWLEGRYQTLARLNDLWGRCYDHWGQVELPRNRDTFVDMVDWRLFALDVLAGEASLRLAAVRKHDRRHPAYLHPVPNTMNPMNSITCVDDFLMAQECDVFGGTVNGWPTFPLQAVAAAQGRVCYNVESHVRVGARNLYPRPLRLPQVVSEFLPQIGLGIRGILYWQYRCETMGSESPGWGIMETDGTPGPVHAAVTEFWAKLKPVAERLLTAPVPAAQVAILKSTSNEIFQWCQANQSNRLRQGIEGYTQVLYRMNIPLTYVDERLLQAGLAESVKLLVLPDVHVLARPTAEAIVAFLQRGGTVLSEAHLGGYDLSRNRHSQPTPGMGLAEALDLREVSAMAVQHLGIGVAEKTSGQFEGDVAKAIEAFGLRGGDMVPLKMANGQTLLGWSRYAELVGSNLTAIAGLPKRHPCVAVKPVGQGKLYYAGTLLGCLADIVHPGGFGMFLDEVLAGAGVSRPAPAGIPPHYGLRVDPLETPDGTAYVVANLLKQPLYTTVKPTENMRGIYGEMSCLAGQTMPLQLAPQQADLLVPTRWLA
ncbi:MAG: beta-galactosidase [Phycisphaeraceae bacterium]|nr:beta-galactosidase [Phycisphaeraceae bacterium]